MAAFISIFFWLIISIVVGGIIGRRLTSDTMVDYFAGGRTFGTLTTLFALIGSYMSSFIMIGVVGQSYSSGMATFGAVGLATGVVFVIAICLLGIPIFALGKKWNYVTCIDLLVDRYPSNIMRIWFAAVIVLTVVPYLVMQFTGTAMVLTSITKGAVPYWAGLVLTAVILFSYVVMGGYKGVTLVDAVQGFTIPIIIIICLFALLGSVNGGMPGVVETLTKQGLDKMLTIPGQVPMWTYGQFILFAVVGVTMVLIPQNYLRWYAAKDNKSIVWTGILFGLLFPIMSIQELIGGPLARVLVPGLKGTAVDGAFPAAIATLNSPFMVGMFNAALWAAVLSTSASLIIGVSGVITKDIYKHYAKTQSEQQIVKWGRIWTGLILVVAAVIAIHPPTSIAFIGMLSFGIMMQIVPAMISAIYWPRANRYGVLAGSILGELLLFIQTGIQFGAGKAVAISPWVPGWHPSIIALVPNIVVFIVVTLLTPAEDQSIFNKFHGFLREEFKANSKSLPLESKTITDGGKL
jgi:SSS family solute:Na+ symporter